MTDESRIKDYLLSEMLDVKHISERTMEITLDVMSVRFGTTIDRLKSIVEDLTGAGLLEKEQMGDFSFYKKGKNYCVPMTLEERKVAALEKIAALLEKK